MFNLTEKKSIKNKLVVVVIWCLAIIIAFAGSVAAQSGKLPIPQGTDIQRNVKYVSESGNHYLVFQADGNLVVYDKTNRFIWGVNLVSNDFKRAARANFSAFGIFGLYDDQGKPIWSPSNSGTADLLTITDNGTLVLIERNGSIVWKSNTNNAGGVKVPSSDSVLDLKTNLPGTWSGNPKFVISQDRITAIENGQVKWSGRYTITGKDTIAITYDDGREVKAEMIVSEKQQGPKLVKRLGWNVNNVGGGSIQWESSETQVPVYNERLTITGHNDSVTSVAFSPDGKTLASGSHDKTIKLWRVK